MPTYKELKTDSVNTTLTVLNQLVDFVPPSSSVTRETHHCFVTSSRGGAVTSSMFQTIFDQDVNLQTANSLFDISVGIFSGSSIISNASTGEDASGKILFSSESLMMREKKDIYSQFAQQFLGDSNSQFSAPFGSTSAADKIDSALFLTFHRLFTRDGIKRETFAMKFFTTAAISHTNRHAGGQDNIFRGTDSGSIIFVDAGSNNSLMESAFAGPVGNLVESSNTSNTVGLIFYNGAVVLDVAKVISGTQKASGSIGAVGNNSGKIVLGAPNQGNTQAKFIPDFMVSASIDDICDHFSTVRFGSGSSNAIVFQNNTEINSKIYFCQLAPGEFNYSSNPTFINQTTGRIKSITANRDGIAKSFSYFTTIGLHDPSGKLVAVAKMSRPIEKNDEKDITIRVRLDF